MKKHFRNTFTIAGLFLCGILFTEQSACFAAGPESFVHDNVLIFVVNNLTKSRLPLYANNAQVRTPNVDLLARDAYVFENLISPASYTPPAIYELISGEPSGPDLFVNQTSSAEFHIPELSKFPLGRFLEEQGYAFVRDGLPQSSEHPFISFVHIWDLHYPYDLFRRREKQLPPELRKLYRDLLKNIDDISLVPKASDSEAFPALVTYLAFGVRRTEIPIDDAAVWNALLVCLKETGNSPAGQIARALPPSLGRRLVQIRSSDDLHGSDKAAIIQALNGMICDPDSPIGRILFGPGAVFKDDDLFLDGVHISRWDWAFVLHLNKLVWSRDSFLKLDANGRLSLMGRPDPHQKELLRQIYREALEYFLPALTARHPQHLFVDPKPEAVKSWMWSRRYASDFALIQALYDANLSDVDERFGEYMAGLKRLNVLEKTVIVFAGDHGEGLLHGILERGEVKCYDKIINPPLVIRAPGRPAKKVLVETQLRTADVLPTVVGLLGFQPPASAVKSAGVNLVSALDGGPSPHITAFSRSLGPSRAVRRSDGWKLVFQIGDPKRELFNWKSDPGEIHDMADKYPRFTADLEEEFNQFLYGK